MSELGPGSLSEAELAHALGLHTYEDVTIRQEPNEDTPRDSKGDPMFLESQKWQRTRVEGGWIYERDGVCVPVFVPDPNALAGVVLEQAVGEAPPAPGDVLSAIEWGGLMRALAKCQSEEPTEFDPDLVSVTFLACRLLNFEGGTAGLAALGERYAFELARGFVDVEEASSGKWARVLVGGVEAVRIPQGEHEPAGRCGASARVEAQNIQQALVDHLAKGFGCSR